MTSFLLFGEFKRKGEGEGECVMMRGLKFHGGGGGRKRREGGRQGVL